MKRGAWVASLFVTAFLGACDTETSLEQTPEASDQVCPGNHVQPGVETTDDWGTVTPTETGVAYEINPGYTVDICVKGGSGDEDTTGYIVQTVIGSGTLTTPPNNAGNIPELSHYSVTSVIPPDETVPDETVPDETVPSQELTSTTIDEATTITEGGGTVNPTTTVEVGGGDLTTTADGEGTLDPSQESSTTGDDVAGGSDETLPATGTGQVSLSGLAGMLLGAGAILLLLVRRRSRED